MPSSGSSELRIGFHNEPSAQVLETIERLVETAIDDESSPVQISIGHQRYLDLDAKVKKNSTEDLPIWNLLKQVPVITLQRINFHFEFRVTSAKEEERYEKQKQRLQTYVSKLAERLQRKLPDETKDVSVDGNSERVEEPMETCVTGCASILFSTPPGEGAGAG